MAVVTQTPEQAFAAYLKERRIVLADASPSSRSGLQQAMTELGAKDTNIFAAASFEDAEAMITKVKPQIVISDYNLGSRCGLDLLQKQRAEQPDLKQGLFVLVTANTSQSAVARAAEEDIDAYILKPFTAFSLRQTLMKTAISKINPSEYLKKIEAGKSKLAKGEIDEAIKNFEEAKTLATNPSLACFYLGQAHLVKQAADQAEGKYTEGLDYNKIHYKCLVGLYDVYMSKQRYPEAYQVVKRISQYFPANPQRLTSVLKLAILTQSYDDVERYYQLFTKIEERNEEVVRYVCAALVVCGKYYLGAKVQSRAVQLFKKAAQAGLHRPKVLQEIIVSLIEANLAAEASEFLKKFPPDQQSGPVFKGLDLLVFDKLKSNPTLSIEKGQILIKDGVEDPWVYRIMIQRTNETGLMQLRDELVGQATKRFPELKDKFQVGPTPTATAVKPAPAATKSPALKA